MTVSARSDARIPGAAVRPPGAYGPQRSRPAAVGGRLAADTRPHRSRARAAGAATTGEPSGATVGTTRHPAVTGPFLRVVLVAPAAENGVDRSAVSSDNPVMDPVIAALAQLVRDRYDRERAEKAAQRHRLRVVEGKSA